jgi:hypothetical protein
MNPLARQAVVLDLARQLRLRGSWCGETHIQKSAYLGQELFSVPTGFEFILYKHGPFSFELRDELVEMRGNGLLERVPQAYPYGPTLKLGPRADAVLGMFPKTLAKYTSAVAFVCDRLGPADVAELERLATALYVTRKSPDATDHARANILCGLKPHIDPPDALAAVRRVDSIIDEAEAIQVA